MVVKQFFTWQTLFTTTIPIPSAIEARVQRRDFVVVHGVRHDTILNIHSMNRIHLLPPAISRSALVYGTPLWLVGVFRGVFGFAALLVMLLSLKDWTVLPLPVQLLVPILTPSMLALSVWSRPWNRTVSFIANESGLFFPTNSPIQLGLTPPAQEHWLQVPWSRIDNLRISREVGEDFPALAFDIQISDAERTEFFTHVGQAVDGDSQHGYDLSLAFSHALPTPKSTLKKLLLLRGRQETCS